MPAVDARAVEDVILDLASRGAAGAGFSPPAANIKGIVEAAVDTIAKSGRGELVGSEGSEPLSSLEPGAAVQSLLSGEFVWVMASEPTRLAARPADVTTPIPPAVDLAPDQLWLVPFDAAAIQRGRILNRPIMMELSGMLHGLAWESWVEIHPIDARERNIALGDRVRIRGPRAEISSRAIVTRTVPPGALAAPVGFGHEALGSIARGRGTNPLKLPFAVIDDQTGAPAWGPVPVFITKV
jgi:hypothetical protein